MDTADNQSINFVLESGDQVKVECSSSDSVLKLKHKLFVEKDLPVEQLVLNKMGKQLDDNVLVKDLDLQDGQGLQVIVQDCQLISSNNLYDVVRKDDCCYLRYKEDDGEEVYKQYGIAKSQTKFQLNFKDQPTPSIKQLLLQDKLTFYQLPGNYKLATLTLASDPGQALCLADQTMNIGGTTLYWVELGPKEKALKVYITHYCFGDTIKVAEKMGHHSWQDDNPQFDVAKNEYHDGNKVVIWKNHNGANQWFVVNEDRTISPCLSPQKVWCFDEGSLRIRKRGSKGQLVFDSLEPSYQTSCYLKLAPSSHPGKGIVFTGEERQHGHGQEEMITLGNADEAESVFIDENGFIHSKTRTSQVFDGHDHHGRDLEFFPMHEEYGHQKFLINQDGTIALKNDPTWVLGTDADQKRVKFVKRGDEHQFFFDQAPQYLIDQAKKWEENKPTTQVEE